jgi:YHS domain-containing protein
MKFSRLMRLLVFLLTMPFAGSLLAVGGINTQPATGPAIHGYDPVAYFVAGEPQRGDKALSYDYQGVTWRFANAANKQIFIESPDAYIPQYGGHCAFAASKNAIADIDPAAWTIDKGKLYLNYNLGVRSKWRADQAVNIKKADGFWPELVKKVK